ncbi:MAG: hypothetical protein ABL996_18815 [Micropepsaceae bacterium]
MQSQALKLILHTEPADTAASPPRRTILHTASSFACSSETAELGEDYAELQKIDRAYRLLERRLTRAAVRLNARDAISTVTEFNLLLADARNDAAWGPTLDLAKDAAEEARVIKIASTVAPRC